jgi:hypothetical protein
MMEEMEMSWWVKASVPLEIKAKAGANISPTRSIACCSSPNHSLRRSKQWAH